jgi:hypothetical protein
MKTHTLWRERESPSVGPSCPSVCGGSSGLRLLGNPRPILFFLLPTIQRARSGWRVPPFPTANHHRPLYLLLLLLFLVFSLSYDITSSHITLDDSRVSGTHPATTCTCRILVLFQKGKKRPILVIIIKFFPFRWTEWKARERERIFLFGVFYTGCVDIFPVFHGPSPIRYPISPV